jgi:hypothetical protein
VFVADNFEPSFCISSSTLLFPGISARLLKNSHQVGATSKCKEGVFGSRAVLVRILGFASLHYCRFALFGEVSRCFFGVIFGVVFLLE